MKRQKTLLVIGPIVIAVAVFSAAFYYYNYPCCRFYHVSQRYGAGSCVSKARKESKKLREEVKENIEREDKRRILNNNHADFMERCAKLEKVCKNRSDKCGELKQICQQSETDMLQLPRPVNYELACALPPRRIEGNKLDEALPPALCGQMQPSTVSSKEKEDIIRSALAVGALIVRLRGCTSGCGKGEFWGTGFMIADHIFAMTCHAVHPLLRINNGARKFAVQYKLVVRFHDGESLESYEFPIDDSQEVKCSEKEGLDVALLTILDGDNQVSPPSRLPVFLDKPSKLEGEKAAVIGYADLSHFLDKHAEEFYHCYEINETDSNSQCKNHDYDHLKFALMDWIGKVETCDDNLHILPDVADTTLGESGAPVINFRYNQTLRDVALTDLDGSVPPFTKSLPARKDPLVIGIHTCCSEYFPNDEKYLDDELPQYEDIYKDVANDEAAKISPPLPCGHLRRTLHNQAVSTYSILQDPGLCEFLQGKGDKNGVDARDWEGNKLTVTCTPLTTTSQNQSAHSPH